MSLNILNPLSAQDYDSRLKAFIKSVEGQKLDVYLDTGGNPTIGWGFALNTNSKGLWRNADALNYFLHTILGVDPEEGSNLVLAHFGARRGKDSDREALSHEDKPRNKSDSAEGLHFDPSLRVRRVPDIGHEA